MSSLSRIKVHVSRSNSCSTPAPRSRLATSSDEKSAELIIGRPFPSLSSPTTEWKTRFEEFASKTRIAIIGTRRTHPWVRGFLEELLAPLAPFRQNIDIVSGLALGVDCLAHQIALKHGFSTTAVVAGGSEFWLERQGGAPQQQHTLRKILDQGGLVFADENPEYSPLPFSFLLRNELLVHLASAVLLVQAPARSGALHTMNHARIAGVPRWVVRPPKMGSKDVVPGFEGNRALIDGDAGTWGAQPILNSHNLMSALEQLPCDRSIALTARIPSI